MIQNTSIAVIGCGYWGKNLVRNFQQIGVLKLICDKNETLLAQFKDQYPNIEKCLALNDVLTREDIHAIVIATPAETHFTLTREALLNGKHVFVEKPLALTVEDAKELVELAENKQLTLMVGHLLQYHPAFMKLKELASNGELGRINYIYSHRLNLGKIRREENILWSFAPHDISMILSIAGEEPETVLSTGGNYLHKMIADVTTTHLEFQSGLKGHVFVSWLHPFKEQKLVVVGDQRMAVFDDMKPWTDKLLFYPHEIKWKDNIPVPAKAEAERIDIPHLEPLRLECDHFLDCISNGKQPVTDGHEGTRVLKVLNASQESLDDHGKKIFLNPEKKAGPVCTSIRSFTENDTPDVFVHETAVIDPNVTIGTGSKVWHFSHILPGSKIGRNCNIGQNAAIGPNVNIGNNCKIQNNVSIYKGVSLEDGVFCGPSMVFTNVYNPRAELRKMDQLRPTLVKKGATIGANATIVCGINLGRYSFIGAGAVVTKDVADHALVVGNPAKQIGWVCECGESLDGKLTCTECEKFYKDVKNGLEEK